ncbi:hypothetical protein IGI04_025372 [Brassica rapa subsp. trilocularis]|uniref:Uncharacterized protein n=1 Tax=Brassica rapa subsp. trilocularis TaxID=1813537 RepID=A0ABQ7M9E1_BRACM|nr:hypothetical protein IGI04_025372 [Brassica rapa subsp. trilocularis]
MSLSFSHYVEFNYPFSPPLRKPLMFDTINKSCFSIGNQTNLKEGGELIGLTCSYLMKRVSPDRYRFIRPESGLELSQRRDRNLYGSGVPKSTPFQPYSERSFFEWLTGVTWQNAGKPLPFSISTLIRIKVLVTGYIEFQHNAELYSEAFVPINPIDSESSFTFWLDMRCMFQESLDFMCVLNGCLDLMQVENVEKLISAKSSSSAGAALEGIHASLCPPFKG